MNNLSNDIYRLEYSEKQRLLHFESCDSDKKTKDWVFLKMLQIDDCVAFSEFMEKKYVDGRKSGCLPEIKVVKLELDLFLELKKYGRKLSGRV